MLKALDLPVLRTEKVLVDAEASILEIRKRTQSLIITDEDSLQVVVESLNLAKRIEKILIERRKEKTEPLKSEAKAIEADFAKFIGPVTDIKETLNRLILEYHAEQERMAEQMRREAERLAREAEEKRLKELEEARRKAEEQHQKEVEEAKAKGVAPPSEPLVIEEPAEHEALVIPIPEVRNTFRSMSGTLGIRKVWKAEVTDLKALCRAVAEGKAPIQCVEANMTFLDKQAKAFEGALDIPGVTCNHVPQTASR